MRYLMLIRHDEAAMAHFTAADWQKMAADYGAFTAAISKADIAYRPGQRLEPSPKARSVRLRDGKRDVLDGPYADTKEQLASFFTIDVPDLDAAIAWAARCPSARHGSVEIRPVWVQTETTNDQP
jgi:hypothetical protein